jgi:membrane protease YdiL (CAAX protease family)
VPEPASPAPGVAGGLSEPLLTFFVATGLASALYWIARVVPLVEANLHGAIAVIFLAAPRVASRVSGRDFDYRAAGLRLDPVRGNLAVLGTALAVAWPLFFASFLIFYGAACTPRSPGWLTTLTEPFSPVCVRWLGWAGASLRWPPQLWLMALVQVVVVAVPEEMFFRGYLYSRLEERWPSRRRLLGAPVGWPLLVSSAFFGLGHVLVDFDPQRLAVAVPALVFGWMRARTGSIAAGALFHALCNLFSDVLHTSFFR